ncbi:MAG: hypothetical protein MI807_09635, partial [Verrucomicrobiales bacterium]|nr:hypothetical protein [Verrucomicrobiales bacterium]
LTPSGIPDSIRVKIKPKKEKLKKRTSRGIRYRKKKLNLTYRGFSTSDPSSPDAVQIRTKVK